MADNTIGAYHLSDNPALYEVARSNNFEFVVTGLNNVLRAGYNKDDSDATLPNAEEVIRLSVESAFVPSFSQDTITIRRGNSVMKAAGMPTFKDGSLTVRDFIGADTKSALMAWQNLSYDVNTEKVGRLEDYKKDCYLLEYTPDYRLVRQWLLKGCFISDITMPEFNLDSGDKRNITATILYDSYKMSMPDDE